MDPDFEYTFGEYDSKQLHQHVAGTVSEDVTEPLTEFQLREGSNASGSAYTDSEAEPEKTESEVEDGYQSLKRSADGSATPRPFKRQKGLLNVDYLNLLNRDIEDAAHRVYLADEVDVEPSQLGMTYWSSLEKKLFFEAVARLGRDDLPGIASMVGTKSVIEVNHYLDFLQNAQRLRRADGLRAVLEFAEYPAAVELSQPCCHALEEAADAISVRQERREEQREESKWGMTWDINPRIARQFEQGKITAENHQLPSAQLFHLPMWLQLSERVFMNSSIPGDNWSYIDDHQPSVWATTFEDFHSLAVSITRRLVQTTVFMSISRIRAKKELISKTRNVVRRKDVEAAVASLGMAANSRDFWHTSARRLRLEVYEEPPDRDEDGEEEPLTFDEVEAALSDEPNSAQLAESDSGSDLGLLKLDLPSDEQVVDESEYETPWTMSDEEGHEISQEAHEVLRYSTADFPETYRTKESLKLRIATERQQEQYAGKCDQYISCQAEAEMWEILQKPPPMELPKAQDPGPQPRSKMDVESIYPIGQNWRSKMSYHSEWEANGGHSAQGDIP